MSCISVSKADIFTQSSIEQEGFNLQPNVWIKKLFSVLHERIESRYLAPNLPWSREEFNLQPNVWIKKILFSNSKSMSLSKNDIVVFVGPNNSGKSAALRGIRDKFTDSSKDNPIIQALEISREGSGEDLTKWLETTTLKKRNENNSLFIYQAFGKEIYAHDASYAWSDPQHQLSQLSPFFCHLLTADERLQAANPAPNISLTKEAPQHPIHYLLRDDELELRLSRQFRRAFGSDLVLHRNAGNIIPLHIGERPQPKQGEDRVSVGYVSELEKLPPIETQGDGMRSFAGVLLYASVGRHTILLIDEPEAFLHPPQARQLGRMLVSDKPIDRQLFIATHSGDLLRGVLDADNMNVRIVRIRRSRDTNHIKELSHAQVEQLWNDPFLRYSNILDGIFHERVVICESDSDSRFYAAVLDSLCDDQKHDRRRPDLMFTNCGGKARLPLAIRSLRELDVPVIAVADFDVLNDRHPLQEIAEAVGIEWSSISTDWNIVKTAIDSKRPELNSKEVSAEILEILGAITEATFPSSAKQKIQAILRRSSPWSQAKTVGKAFTPSGQATQACERLFVTLQQRGIFLVPTGELESFARSVGGHGPSWVNEVLKKNLKSDPELQAAREFVLSFVAD